MQYECIKSELKEEYDRKIDFLKGRIKRRAAIDPSYWVFAKDTTSTTNDKTPKHPLTNPGRNAKHPLSKAPDLTFPLGDSIKLTEKDRYFEFYLKSAQRAIDIMR